MWLVRSPLKSQEPFGDGSDKSACANQSQKLLDDGQPGSYQLAGLGLTAALGLRYPLKMLPILLFELTWKAIYLIAFALPLWSAHQINDATAEDIKAVLMVVIFIPLIPWRYVFVHFVLKHGDRWK